MGSYCKSGPALLTNGATKQDPSYRSLDALLSVRYSAFDHRLTLFQSERVRHSKMLYSFNFQPRLAGRVVNLRPVRAEDFQALFLLASDRRVWEQHPSSDRYLESNFRPYFLEGLTSQKALTAVSMVTGEIVGWSRYSNHRVQSREIEIGWTFLGFQYWGAGFNYDMKHAMLIHAFETFDTVLFFVGKANARSRKAVEKLGAVAIPQIIPAATEQSVVTYRLTSAMHQTHRST